MFSYKLEEFLCLVVVLMVPLPSPERMVEVKIPDHNMVVAYGPRKHLSEEGYGAPSSVRWGIV
jgi:hypothetical protein